MSRQICVKIMDEAYRILEQYPRQYRGFIVSLAILSAYRSGALPSLPFVEKKKEETSGEDEEISFDLSDLGG